jgi:DNA polymerase III subunit beta
MKIIIEKQKVIQALDAVMKAIKKSPLQLLEGVLISTHGNGVTFTGTDAETTIEFSQECGVLQSGIAVVKADLFYNIIKSMPSDVMITVSENLEMNIQSKNVVMDIKCMDSKGFPETKPVKTNCEIKIDQTIFKTMVSNVAFCASVNELKPNLKGIFINVKNGSFEMVAIDGYIGAIRKMDIDSKDVNVLVDGKILETVSKAFGEGEMTIYIGATMVEFVGKNIRTTIRTLNHQYVNYDRIIGMDFPIKATVETKKLRSSVERASLLMDADEKKYLPAMFKITDNAIGISSRTSLGKFDESIDIEKSGNDLCISFDPRKILNCLRKIEEPKITIEFATDKSPCLMKSKENENFVYFLTPVLTRSEE